MDPQPPLPTPPLVPTQLPQNPPEAPAVIDVYSAEKILKKARWFAFSPLILVAVLFVLGFVPGVNFIIALLLVFGGYILVLIVAVILEVVAIILALIGGLRDPLYRGTAIITVIFALVIAIPAGVFALQGIEKVYEIRNPAIPTSVINRPLS